MKTPDIWLVKKSCEQKNPSSLLGSVVTVFWSGLETGG